VDSLASIIGPLSWVFGESSDHRRPRESTWVRFKVMSKRWLPSTCSRSSPRCVERKPLPSQLRLVSPTWLRAKQLSNFPPASRIRSLTFDIEHAVAQKIFASSPRTEW